MKRLLLVLILVLAASFAAQAADTGTITVVVKGLHSNDGRVSGVLFKSAEGWPKDASKAAKIARAPVKDKSGTLVFDKIPYGEYAFVILHDENKNGKMDYSAIGMPKEGYAFSNNAKGMLGAPDYKDAKFKLDKPKLNQDINIIY